MEQRTILSPRFFDDRYLTAAFVTARLAAHVPGRPGAIPALSGDADLNPGFRPSGPLRAAAVLVPIVVHADHLTVLLTRRTSHLAHHAGQISFPGGRVDDGDADAVSTALREAYEEVGLPAEKVSVIGELALYTTITHFAVTPIVGLVQPPLTIVPDPYEVAEVFEVPLGWIVDPRNRRIESHEAGGIPRRYYTIFHEGRRIWGATAAMLVNLAALLGPDPP